MYPGSKPAGALVVEGDTATRPYTVSTGQVEQVLSYFSNSLSDWEETDVADVGQALRTEFTRNGSVLEVSAIPVEDTGSSQTVQNPGG